MVQVEADGSSCAERPVGERKANVGVLDVGYVERASRTLARPGREQGGLERFQRLEPPSLTHTILCISSIILLDGINNTATTPAMT